jgi:chromosome segregation ATPase
MVKHGSFLQRLKDRWGTGSGVRVDRGGVAAAKATDRLVDRAAPVQRVEPERGAPVRDVATDFAPADTRSTRKLSDREEAMLALSTHFQELTSLLRGSQARVDDQLTRLVGATSALTQLPALSQQQLDTLRALSTQMEKQNTLGEQLAGTMTKLPSMLENVEAALARAAATDERTAATVREFQSTMDRIHSAMGQMVQHGEQHVRTAQGLAERRDHELQGLVTGMQQTQERAVSQLQRTTEDSLQSLRRTHEDQSNRLQRVVQEHAGWNRAVLVGIGLVVLGIGALIALQLFR